VKPIIEFKPIHPQGPGIVAELGDGLIVPSVDAGWQVVGRDGRVGITEYAGNNPITMDIPILFDGHDRDRSVEHEVKSLFRLMRKKVGKREEPARVKLRRFPVPYRSLEWVIDGIAPGDEIRREKDGLRIRAAMTVTVMEYVAGDIVIKKRSPSQKVQENVKWMGGSWL
jgi:hypothetical protein